MNRIKIAMAVMALVLVLGTTTAAFAQGGQPPATPTPPAKSEYAQTFWQILAEKLGVTVDKLQTAIRDALKATVSKMLGDGKLTQQQADKINSGIDSMPLDRTPFGGFMDGRFRGRVLDPAPLACLFHPGRPFQDHKQWSQIHSSQLVCPNHPGLTR